MPTFTQPTNPRAHTYASPAAVARANGVRTKPQNHETGTPRCKRHRLSSCSVVRNRTAARAKYSTNVHPERAHSGRAYQNSNATQHNTTATNGALVDRVGGALLVALLEVGHLLTTGRPDVAQMVFNCFPMMLIFISQSFHFARTSLARVFALHVAVSPAIAADILFREAHGPAYFVDRSEFENIVFSFCAFVS